MAEQLLGIDLLLKRFASLEAEVAQLQEEALEGRECLPANEGWPFASRECRAATPVGTEQRQQPQAAEQRWVSEERVRPALPKGETGIGRAAGAQRQDPAPG